MMNIKSSTWTCSGYYLSHDPSVAKCPACNTPQSSIQSAPAAPSAASAAAAPSASPASAPTITASHGTSLLDLLNIKSGTWTCTVCYLSHDPGVAKCPACNTPQSSTQSAPAAAAPRSTPASAPTITASDDRSLLDLLNIKSGTWTCSGCYLSHDPSVAKCPACNPPQSSTQSAPAAPSASSAAAAPSADPVSAPTITASDGRSLRELMNIKSSTWTCSGCYLSHDPSVAKCPACNTPQSSTQSAPAALPAAAPSATPASAPTITASDGRSLLDLLNSAPSATPDSAPTITASDGRSLLDLLNCTGCYLSHDPSVAKCPACNTPQSSTQSARAAPSATPASAPTITASDGRSLLDLLNCTGCYLSHDPGVAKCPACNTPQSSTQSAPAAPSASSAAAAPSATPASVPTITASDGRSLRDLLNIKSGTWTCSGCCFSHDPSVAKCPACNTPQSSTQSVPAAAAPSANPNSAPTITASDGGSLREMMNIKSSTWTCSGCYLSHDPSVAKYPACNTPQSSTQSAPGAPSAASTAAAPSATPASAPTITASDGRSLRDLLNIKAGTWTCTGCYLSHDPGVYKCPACNTPQSSSQSAPAAAALSATPASAPTITASDDRPLRDLLNIKSGRGACSGCYCSDDPSVAKCPACNTPRSSTQSVPTAPSAASAAAAAPSADPVSAPTITASDGRSLCEMMNIKSSTWTCSGCYLSHDLSVAKCPACNTPQSSTQSAPAASSATPASAPTIINCQ
ncbi:nuclear pore complex protein Nup153-like [Sycon ciliatum]|uniref:nuclear pore complex protein Nup153-like n=1 Tax=Sycon ciliatum TaxID=27933 RepID=UPI0031F62723